MTPFEARRALQRAFLRLERAILSLRRAEVLAGRIYDAGSQLLPLAASLLMMCRQRADEAHVSLARAHDDYDRARNWLR